MGFAGIGDVDFLVALEMRGFAGAGDGFLWALERWVLSFGGGRIKSDVKKYYLYFTFTKSMRC